MAKKSHLTRVRNGTWNAWRARHETQPDLRGASFRGEVLEGIDLNNALLNSATFREAQIDDVTFTNAVAAETDFTGAMISGGSFAGVRATSCVFSDTDISDVTFADAELVDCHFGNAALDDCDFSGAVLRGCSFTAARIWNCLFRSTRIDGVDFSKSLFRGVVFANTPLQGATGLDAIVHVGPSTVGLDTFFASGGLPEAFLIGVGTPAVFTEYASSLVGLPVVFDSCFISYSSADELFVRRLHRDLIAAGIRCWFAPHDLKTGDRIRARIDESIQLHDKLLVVLSYASLASDWVEAEVGNRHGTRAR